MRLATAIVAAMAIAGCAERAHWTRTDTVLEAAGFVAQVIDYRQTVAITNDCREMNPLIGACGGAVSPLALFATTALVRLGISALLPHPWRSAWQGAMTGYQVHVIVGNWRAGYAP